MARKKSRQANRAPAAPVPHEAIVATPPTPAARSSTAVTTTPQATARITPPLAEKNRPEPQRAWIELAAIRAARLFGSLQLAIVLLSLFTLAVFLGTLMEHWYSTKVAQELVYKSWWFVLLLLLLAVNIFFAAAKKWPFKKHQTGFVITHIGLLTMLFGGILHWAAGTDAQVAMHDSDRPFVQAEMKRRHSLTQSVSEAIYSDVSSIRVFAEPDDLPGRGRRGPGEDARRTKLLDHDFEPGPLPWKAGHSQVKSDLLLSFMTWLANPLGRSWSASLGGGARLEVIDYLPAARREHYSPSDQGGFPAIKVMLRSTRFDGTQERWMALDLEGREDDHDPREVAAAPGSPIIVEFIGRCPDAALDEFLNPPLESLGKKGMLVIIDPATKRPLRLPVDSSLGKLTPIPGSTVAVRVTRYLPNAFTDPKGANADEAPVDPGVEFELHLEGKKVGTFRAFARATGLLEDPARPGQFRKQAQSGDPVFWYHAPDVRQGRNALGVLQFVDAGGRGIFFRSFNVRDGKPNLEKAGAVRRGEETAIWDKMGWRFALLEHIAEARPAVRYTPAPVQPGKQQTVQEKEEYTAAIECRLTVGKDSRDFWLPQGATRTVDAGGKRFTVQYTYKHKPLGFTIKLERAEQTVDPGTQAPASYSSWVQIFDKELGVNGERHLITMNEPLVWRGYKFYQSNYEYLQESEGKPVSYSGLTVGHDPGLVFKYAGSLMLGVGIFIMFYMKAYFFKPRGRRESPAAPAPQPG